MNHQFITQDKKLFIADSISTHSGKMAGIPSISTSALENTICSARRQDNNTVCSHCYACQHLNYRKALKDKCKRNHDFFTTQLITAQDVPKINASSFRFESFGELQNVTQLQNYVTIANANVNTVFTLWTKNMDIVKTYAESNICDWHDNFKIIASSRLLNISDYSYYCDEYYSLFDAVFTVYTKEYAKEHNIDINCIGGTGACLECGRCYDWSLNTDYPIEINEILK